MMSTMTTSSPRKAFCTYNRIKNRIKCGLVTCSTASPNNGADKLPSGYYYVGKNYSHPKLHVQWFNLYRKRTDWGFWDYYTNIPELDCRGRFGLHYGAVSEGCVTVTDSYCFTRLSEEINSYLEKEFDPHKCRGCGMWGCLFTQRVKRVHTCDLDSV